jgi:hypothetical protein
MGHVLLIATCNMTICASPQLAADKTNSGTENFVALGFLGAAPKYYNVIGLMFRPTNGDQSTPFRARC